GTRLLFVGASAIVLAVLRRRLPSADGVPGGDAVASLIGTLCGAQVADRIPVLLVAIRDIERAARPLERAAVHARIGARGGPRHRRRIALGFVAGHRRTRDEAAQRGRPVLQDVVRAVVESGL